MKRILTFLCFALTTLPIAPVNATHPRSRVVVTQFAVPVGVPVAQVSPTLYSMRAYAAPSPSNVSRLSTDDQLLDRLADKLLARLSQRESSVRSQAVGDPNTLFAQKCVRCHSGENPKGGLSLEGPLESLDRGVRQESVLRMLQTDPNKRMPKDAPPLEAQEFQTLFRALFL